MILARTQENFQLLWLGLEPSYTGEITPIIHHYPHLLVLNHIKPEVVIPMFCCLTSLFSAQNPSSCSLTGFSICASKQEWWRWRKRNRCPEGGWLPKNRCGTRFLWLANHGHWSGVVWTWFFNVFNLWWTSGKLMMKHGILVDSLYPSFRQFE